MLAFLDSGIGGLTVARSLQALRPDADILYLADKANAPYGTKSERELLPILERAIRALLARGADRVVLACITASCLYDRLPCDISPRVIPILPFVAEAIAKQKGHIGMIATEATVKSVPDRKKRRAEPRSACGGRAVFYRGSRGGEGAHRCDLTARLPRRGYPRARLHAFSVF